MSAAAAAPTNRVVIDTTVGKVEILFEERSGIISAYRFDTAGRPIAAAFENWGFRDLQQVLRQDCGVPEAEAQEIAEALAEHWHVDRGGPKLEPAWDEVEESTRGPIGMFSFVLAGAATLALLLIVWTTLQAFI